MTDKNHSAKFKYNSDNLEIQKGLELIIVEIVEYVPNAVMSRTIIKKSTGNITAMSLSEGEELSDKSSPFDTFVQIIDGAAVLKMDNTSFNLALGTGMVIPAHALHRFDAKQQFKMITCIIKSGYED
jgi:quercetin dioxygenase-like cupin family protein